VRTSLILIAARTANRFLGNGVAFTVAVADVAVDADAEMGDADDDVMTMVANQRLQWHCHPCLDGETMAQSNLIHIQTAVATSTQQQR
jgi:hypothetical protein